MKIQSFFIIPGLIWFTGCSSGEEPQKASEMPKPLSESVSSGAKFRAHENEKDSKKDLLTSLKNQEWPEVIGKAKARVQINRTESNRQDYLNQKENKVASSPPFVAVDFSVASAVLSKKAKSSLDSVVQQVKMKGDINQIIVLSWSDENNPPQNQKIQTVAQRELAGRRNLIIKNYLNSIKGIDVETHNMSENANSFSKWISTADAKVKNSLTTAGLITTENELKTTNKPSRSVILLK